LSETIEVTPELTTSLVSPSEFVDSAQSVDALLDTVVPPEHKNAGATCIRLFAFRPEGTTERVALAFVGPQATGIAKVFTQYADNLMQAAAAARAKNPGTVVPLPGAQ
jgi:hypothetical protein